MRFLIDTNVLIPAEPTSTGDVEAATPVVTKLLGLLATAKFEVFIHPASVRELAGDTNDERRELRKQLLKKYQLLPSPPAVSEELHHTLGAPQPGTNNAIDNELIAALSGNAINYLVTNDGGIHRKLVKIQLDNRGLYPSDAVAMLLGLAPQEVVPPPAVKLGFCHEIASDNPVFDSLRADYPGFDQWLEKCKLEHRNVFMVNNTNGLAAIAIIKDESFNPNEKVLKICCFKVAEDARGLKYGELLLKAIFDHCIAQGVQRTYLTCFPKQTQLLAMLSDFGFSESLQEDSEELILEKGFTDDGRTHNLNGLDYHIRFGPAKLHHTDQFFIVPIEPRFHRLLFPDREQQLTFFAGETAYGNSIRKAYLCHASTNQLSPGAVLLFYRSGDCRAIQAVGVTESWKRTTSPTEIIEFVGPRTVYTETEIRRMTQKPTLAVMFRYASIDVKIDYDDLVENGCLIGVPQSITQTKPDGTGWIQNQLGM